MDSNKSNAGNQELDPSILVKVEPGTSASTASTNLRTETNLPTSTTRLTSFRVPRDLTLGGNVKLEKSKKIYTPNFNVQRNKTKDDQTATKNNLKSTRERGRGRGQGQRGRGRGRIADNVIQTAGVFSDGIADSSQSSRKYRSSGGTSSSDRSTKQPLEKQKLNLNHNIDKADEEEKLKNLLRDDLIAGSAVPDMENAPIMLPMADDAKLYKEKIKEESVVTKSESLDADVKPVILENGKVEEEKPKGKGPLVQKPVKDEKKLITVPQIVANESNNYILIQFPDCLPGLKADEELRDPRAKKAADSRTESSSENNPKTESNEYCTLNNLKEGFLGKLQILKSGNARLVLGDNKLIVDVGSHISFRQDLIAAKLNSEKLNGDLINLGSIGSTLICLPDWESMLANL